MGKAIPPCPLFSSSCHVVWLRFGNAADQANALADLVDDIVVKINGKAQRIHSAVQLNANGINGAVAIESVLFTTA